MAAAAGSFKCARTQCLHLKFNSFNIYLSHVRNYHIHEPIFSIRCPMKSCFRSYKLISSLTSHLRRKHGGQIETNNDTFDDGILEEQDILTAAENVQPDCEKKDEVDYTSEEKAVKEIALFALKTQELNRLSDIATNTILENTHRLLQQNELEIKARFKKCIENTGLDPKDIEGLDDFFHSESVLATCMKKLNTSLERNNYLKGALNMVVCISLVIISFCLTHSTKNFDMFHMFST